MGAHYLVVLESALTSKDFTEGNFIIFRPKVQEILNFV
jgi:hypothetical protein